MSLIFADPGGAVYNNVGPNMSNLMSYWGNAIARLPDANFFVGIGSGRVMGNSALIFNSVASNRYAYLQKSTSNQNVLGVCLALKLSSLPDITFTPPIIQFYDNTSLQSDLRLNYNGSLVVTRNGIVLGTTPGGMVGINNWTYIEFKTTFNSTSGNIYVGINGAHQLSITGINTISNSNNYANTINVGLGNSLVNCGIIGNVFFDNIIIYDNRKTDANGFSSSIVGPLNDVGISWIQPIGSGNITQFIPSSGTDNYKNVNSLTPLGDLSYVYSSGVGIVDVYTFPNLNPYITGIFSIASILYARKDNAGSKIIGPYLYINNSGTPYATGIALGDSYQYYFNEWGQSPGSIPWTILNLSGIQAGQTIFS